LEKKNNERKRPGSRIRETAPILFVVCIGPLLGEEAIS
jgi:hypothetical protein